MCSETTNTLKRTTREFVWKLRFQINARGAHFSY